MKLGSSITLEPTLRSIVDLRQMALQMQNLAIHSAMILTESATYPVSDIHDLLRAQRMLHRIAVVFWLES